MTQTNTARPALAKRFSIVLFLALATPFCFLFALLLPPFQAPDEFQHYFYSVSLSHGNLLPLRTAQGIGGYVDSADIEIAPPFNRLPFHADEKLSRGEIDTFYAARQRGERTFVTYEAAALYPPIAYAAPAVGLALSRSLGLSPGASFVAGRIVAAAVFLTLVAVALRLLPSGHAVFLAVLLVPTQIQQAASYSEDSIAFGLAALSLAMLARCGLQKGQRVSRSMLVATIAVLMALAIIKFPYSAFGLIGVVAFWHRSRIAAVLTPLLTAGASFAWVAIYSRNYASLLSTVSPRDQLGFILLNPLSALRVLVDTLYVNGRFYLQGFFGILGWLDTRLPPWSYDLGLLVLLGSLVVSLRWREASDTLLRFAFLGAALIGSLLVFLALYLTWTPVGGETVLGVQGRYLVPALLALAPALAGCQNSTSRSSTIGLGLVLAGAAIWLPVAILCLGLRFYF